MPSVDLNLELPRILSRAIQQNNVEWVICDLLVAIRDIRTDPDAHKWSNHLYLRSITTTTALKWEEQIAIRDAVIKKLEGALQTLDPNTRLIEVSKVGRP